MSRHSSVWTIILACSSLGTPLCSAAVVYVRATTPGTIHDGTSWSRAYQEIHPAISTAQPSDEVWVAAGVYIGTIKPTGPIGLYGGFAGTETERSERKPTENITILDGALSGSPIVELWHDCTIDGFTIRNGRGGGVRCASGTSWISNNVIRANRAVEHGGGIYCREGTSTVIVGNVIDGNNAPHGGAIEIRSTALIARNTIRGNSGMVGSGTVTCWGGPVRILSNLIVDNAAEGILLQNAQQYVVSSNVIAWNAGTGVNCGTQGVPSLISGNTIVRNTNGVSNSGNSAVFANNVIAFNFSVGCLGTGTLTDPVMRSNCIFGNREDFTSGLPWDWPDSTGQNGNIKADPLLVNLGNLASSDYRLSFGSPCLDAGDDAFIEAGARDREGRLRIIGSHTDIGAHEYGVVDEYTVLDGYGALSAWGGFSAPGADSYKHLNADRGGTSAQTIDMYDTVWIVRRALGIDPA